MDYLSGRLASRFNRTGYGVEDGVRLLFPLLMIRLREVHIKAKRFALRCPPNFLCFTRQPHGYTGPFNFARRYQYSISYTSTIYGMIRVL